jgi:rRNA maturation RNase YbeY
LAIVFHDEQIVSGLKNRRQIKEWLAGAMNRENKSPDQINIILTTDKFLQELNSEYLSRDYLTDVIAFDYSEGNTVSGDVFISMERIRENAEIYGEGETKELLRVMIHGLLHLAGYRDGTEAERNEMKGAENRHLEDFFRNT